MLIALVLPLQININHLAICFLFFFIISLAFTDIIGSWTPLAASMMSSWNMHYTFHSFLQDLRQKSQPPPCFDSDVSPFSLVILLLYHCIFMISLISIRCILFIFPVMMLARKYHALTTSSTVASKTARYFLFQFSLSNATNVYKNTYLRNTGNQPITCFEDQKEMFTQYSL